MVHGDWQPPTPCLFNELVMQHIKMKLFEMHIQQIHDESPVCTSCQRKEKILHHYIRARYTINRQKLILIIMLLEICTTTLSTL